MPRTILLDANVIIEIKRGNREAAITLRKLIKDGHRVWISAQAHFELVDNPQLRPQSRRAQSMILEELRIPIAPPGDAAVRWRFIAGNNPAKGGLAEPTDVQHGAQIAALRSGGIDAELWSFDGAFRNNHQQLLREKGVKVAPESYGLPVTGASGGGDYRVARELLGLAPVKIDELGNVSARGPWKPPRRVLPPGKPPSGGGGGGGGPAPVIPGVTGGLKPMVVGSSAKGAKAEAGVTIVLQGVGLVLNVITDHINKTRIEKALAEVEPDIAKYQAKHLEEGTLIVLSFELGKPHPDSQVAPAAVFRFLRFYHGRTLAAARQRWEQSPEITPAPSGGASIITQLIWVDPVAPKPIAVEDLRRPFPRIAEAAFVFKPGAGFTFRDAEWGGETGFDDAGETTLFEGGRENIDEIARWIVEAVNEAILKFYVLKPPDKVKWFWGGRHHDAEIAVVRRRSANGEVLDVVDMDPLLPFETTAALVFPATEDSRKLFQMAPEITDRLHLLRRVPNAHLLRFIEPHNLNVLRMF